MKTELSKQIDKARTLNEIWAAFNQHYNLDEPLPTFTAYMAKGKIKGYLDDIVQKLNIKERAHQAPKITPTKRTLL
jgi:hypothetical protein